MHLSSLVGQKFTRLTVISEETGEFKKKKNRTWKCACECGNILYVPTYKLTTGHTRSCSCLKLKYIDQIKQLQKRIYNETYRDGNISLDEFSILCQKNCYYCNSPPSNKRRIAKNFDYLHTENPYFVYNGLDIINHSTDPLIYVHNHTNTVTACWTCNRAKRNLDYNDFIKLITNIHKNTIDGRISQIIIPFTDEQLCEQMFRESFLTKFSNGRIYKTRKGSGLYNRYWNYLDEPELTFEKFYYLSKLSCWYCGDTGTNFITYTEPNSAAQIYYYNGLDRKDQSKPHTLDNIYPCCRECNKTKTTMSSEEFINWAAKIYNHLNLQTTIYQLSPSSIHPPA